MRKDYTALAEDLMATHLRNEELERELEEQNKSLLKMALRIADLNKDRADLLKDLEESYAQNEELIARKDAYADLLDNLEYEYDQMIEDLKTVSKWYGKSLACGGCSLIKMVSDIDLIVNRYERGIRK